MTKLHRPVLGSPLSKSKSLSEITSARPFDGTPSLKKLPQPLYNAGFRLDAVQTNKSSKKRCTMYIIKHVQLAQHSICTSNCEIASDDCNS